MTQQHSNFDEIMNERAKETPNTLTGILKRIPAYQEGPHPTQSTMINHIDQTYEGQTIEQRVEKIINNNEPITDGAPLIYTERADGVIPEYNPRDDKWDRAIDMTDQIQKNKYAERSARQDQRKEQNKPDPAGQPAQTPPTENPVPKK